MRRLLKNTEGEISNFLSPSPPDRLKGFDFSFHVLHSTLVKI